MANPSYAELQKQIKKLQEQAEKARAAEIEAVIADIKAKIDEYGITAKDLGLSETTKARKKTNDAHVPSPVKYKKGVESWTGKGRQPQWIKDIIASGGDIEKFRVTAE